jgi:periplasmic protein TonB
MDRLQKKCLAASVSLHSFLLLVLILGSAFFVSEKSKEKFRPMKVVPTKTIDDALSGGGGNPNIAPSDAQQKGETLVPQPLKADLVKPTPPRPVPPTPKPEVKKAEPKKPDPKPDLAKVDPPKNPLKSAKDDPKETSKPIKPLDLKPITRSSTDKAQAQAQAQAQAAKERELANKRLAQQLGKTINALKAGFSQGTAIETSGPGGEAYADYSQFVKAIYEDAWLVTDDLTDDDSTARVTVTIAKSGHVISARIEKRSGNSTLDKSVQRALDKVKFVAPFPAGAKDDLRTFTINFNLKAKRLLG